MLIKNKRKLLIVPILFSLFFSSFCSAGQEVIVDPAVISQKAKARDLLEFSVKLTNSTDSTRRFYILVNDVSDKEIPDKKTSLAKWIEVTRGRIEVLPGQEKEIDISVQVNMNAKPGKYYAVITFSQGSTRPDAEANALRFNQPELLLDIEVEEHIVERAQIRKFQTEKNLFFSFPVRFFSEIENIGNREIKPSGSIYIYNRRGEEIDEINLIETVIVPEAKESFVNTWQAGRGLGQYKAVLLAEYGETEKRILQDTVYFWVFPWQLLLFFISLFLLLLFLLIWLISKKFKSRQYQSPQLGKIVDLRH